MSKAAKIFISYCWKLRKEAVRQLADHLSNNYHFNVWIDTNEMAGSTLEAMAKGIDESDVVLIFFGEDYKQSENCKREAEYATMQRKLILPIRIQKDCLTNGWLGMVLGQRLWIDFSEGSKLEETAANVIQQINLLLSQKPAAIIPAANFTAANSTKAPLMKFKTVDVPFFSRFYVRQAEDERFAEEIRKLCDKPRDGVLLLIGGAGTGKTSFLAHFFGDDYRSDFFQRECKFNTVLWLNGFQWNDESSFDEAAEQSVTTKLLQLLQRAAGSETKFFSIDAAVEQLEASMGRHLLLVLDDVYNFKLLESITRQWPRHVPLLAVSRDHVITRQVSCIKRTLTCADFSHDETVEMFKSTYELEDKLTLNQIDQLAHRSCHLPLLVSLLAARFDDCYDYAAEFHLVANEKLSDMLEGPYQSLLQLFKLGLARLEPKLRKSYQTFLFFEPAEPVQVDDLACLWGFSGSDVKIKATALCNMLEKKSLLRRLVKSGEKEDQQFLCFQVHQLLYEALLDDAKGDFKEQFDDNEPILEKIRLKLLAGDSFVENKAKASNVAVLCEAIKRQRRSILERTIANVSSAKLLEMFSSKLQPWQSHGATFLHHLYRSEWADDVASSNNAKRLYAGISHSYRLIAKLLTKLNNDQVDFSHLFLNEKHPLTNHTLLFEIYDGGAEHYDERKPLKHFLNKWKFMYDEECWLAKHGNDRLVKLVQQQELADDLSSLSIDAQDASCEDNLLMIACRFGKVELVKKLIESSKEAKNVINNEGEEGKTACIYAAKNGHLAVVQMLFEKQPSCINQQCFMRRNALSYASENGHLNVATFLIEKFSKDELNQTDYDGRSSLAYASLNGHFEILKLLLERGGKEAVSTRDSDGSTALALATSCGYFEIARYMFDLNPDVARSIDGKGANCLILAAKHGHLALTSYYLEMLPQLIGQLDSNGANALHHAAENGHLPVVRCLLDVTIQLAEQSDKNGQTALMLAAKNGHAEIVAFLLAKMNNFENLKAVDSNNCTALKHAVESGLLDVVSMLFEKYPEALRLASKTGVTCLMAAAANGDAHLVKFLCGKLQQDDQSAFKVKDRKGLTAFAHACLGGSFEAVRCLYEACMETIDMKSSKGQTPLHLAAASGHHEIVKFLADRRIELVDKVDEHSMTPFLYAVSTSAYGIPPEFYVHIARCLYLKNREVIGAHDGEGRNPVELAAAKGKLEMVMFLLSDEVRLTPQQRDNWIRQARSAAASNGQADIAQFLLNLVM